MLKSLAINEARTLANIARRAATLFTEQGYTMEPAFEAVYRVYKPNRPANKLYWPHYLVDTGDQPSCSCEAWCRYQTCKHYLAVVMEQEREAAYIAEYDFLMANAEHDQWGCDPYAEF